MTTLTLRAVERIPFGRDIWAQIGERPDGSRVAWLAADASGIAGSSVVVDDDRVLECPDDVPVASLIDVLVEWPFSRLASLAQVEIGSVVLIVADAGAASRMASACHRRGALLCAVWGSSDSSDTATEFVLGRDVAVENVARALRRSPDAVIVMAGDDRAVAASLALCRDRGVVVLADASAAKIDVDLYPDVHRRGLTVTVTSPLAYDGDERDAWPVVACRLWRSSQMETVVRR